MEYTTFYLTVMQIMVYMQEGHTLSEVMRHLDISYMDRYDIYHYMYEKEWLDVDATNPYGDYQLSDTGFNATPDDIQPIDDVIVQILHEVGNQWIDLPTLIYYCSAFHCNQAYFGLKSFKKALAMMIDQDYVEEDERRGYTFYRLM